MNQKNDITLLAVQILNDKGQEAVGDHLLENDLYHARAYLLLAVDIQWERGEISTEDARRMYKILNFDEKTASRIRQQGFWRQ